MALSDVSTLPPFADAAATARDPARPFALSDLEKCPAYSVLSTQGVLTESHPVSNVYNRCNPRMWVPMEFRRVGYPYWMHCGNRNYGVGVFDPPGAVPTADSLFVSTVPVQYTSAYDSATIAASPTLDQASSTSTPAQVTTSASSPPAAAQSSSDIPASNTTSSSSPLATTQSSDTHFLQSTTPSTTFPTVIAVVGANTLSAIAGSSGILLPGDSTATIGQIATLTDASGSKAIVSVGTSGIYIAGTDAKSTFYTNPTVTPAKPSPTLTAIARFAGQVISAAAGDGSVVVNGQAITSGGQAVTLAGANDVATLGTDGLVVQYSGGTASTFIFPSSTAAMPAAATVAGYAFTALVGASAIVISSQTATLGGKPITLANNDVVSLGSNRVVLQMPGGGVRANWCEVIGATSSTANLANVKAASTSTSTSASITASAGVSASIISNIGNTKKLSLVQMSWVSVGILGALLLV
ncbi:hypothetical protein BDZ45DRAFT_752265 [Acephala macrosclerotiorum]|nr:hypothetical protein BDZ45DRAFT_752265 [Acephala macrosclerotiorum]